MTPTDCTVPPRRPGPDALAWALGAALALGLAAGAAAEGAAPVGAMSAPEARAPLAVFAASDGRVGWEPWITDGTRAGTRLLRNIGRNPSTGRSTSSWPGYFRDLGDGRVIFTALPRGDSGPPAVFVTDGTREGTRNVRAVGSRGGYTPRDYTPLGDGRALFITRNTDNQASLWVTDTTRAGTEQVYAWGRNDFPIRLTSLGNGTAVFTGSFEMTERARYLWMTDGTRAGTRILARIRPGWPGSDPNHITALGDGRVLFSADDGVHGRELWMAEISMAGVGVRMVRDIRAGRMGSDPRDFTPIGGGRALFTAADSYRELYITDGTEAGTRLLREFWTGVGSGSPEWFAPLGDGTVLFAARTREHGRELWRTDGTEDGTRLVRNINRERSSEPSHITPLGDGRAVFWVRNDPQTQDRALWVTDGTFRGTGRVQHFPDITFLRDRLATLGDGRALFTYDNGRTGLEPWVTDGTRAGTHLLRNINRTFQSNPREFTAFRPVVPAPGLR